MARWWLLPALVVVALVSGPVFFATPAPAAEGDGCTTTFPFLSWEFIGRSGGVELYGASIPDGQHQRFLDDVSEVLVLFEGELAAPVGLDVCMVGPRESLAPAGLKNEFQTVQAVAFGPEQVLAIDTAALGTADAGIAYGLTHISLWQVARGLGLDGYPEPLASAIAHWYTSQLRGREDLHHAQIRVSLFFGDPEGTAESSDWVSGAQEPVLLWNPAFTDSPIGDLVGFGVAARGGAVVTQPDRGLWDDIEQEWRLALRDELLEGASGEAFWRIGLAIAIGVVALAIVLAWQARIVKRREAYRVGETEPIPGFFDSG